MGNFELSTVVQDHVVDANNDLVTASNSHGVTLYGNIACFLESHDEEINRIANQVGYYLAMNKGLQITKEYEENSKFIEKFIKNNSIRLKQMEIERSVSIELIVEAVQLLKNGLVFAAKTLCKNMEAKQIKEYVWGLCVLYAQGITNNNIPEYSAVSGMMGYISVQLFGKIRIDFAQTMENFQKGKCIVFEEYQAENVAEIIYLIYAAKHYSSFNNQDKEKDTQLLCSLWNVLGIFYVQAQQLLNKYEMLNTVNAFEYGRMNTAIQSIYTNLTITMPELDRKQVRRVNQELLMFVPNGDRQLATRIASKYVSKAAIVATETIVGVKSSNPLIIETAATGAVSLLKDLSKIEVIGNCLEDCGLNENKVRQCIEAAQKKKKELPAIV